MNIFCTKDLFLGFGFRAPPITQDLAFCRAPCCTAAQFYFLTKIFLKLTHQFTGCLRERENIVHTAHRSSCFELQRIIVVVDKLYFVIFTTSHQRQNLQGEKKNKFVCEQNILIFFLSSKSKFSVLHFHTSSF